MANTYTQLFVHIIFGPKGCNNSIPPQIKEKIHKYITGVIQQSKNKLIAINSMPDHIHILVGLNPEQSIANLVRDIKRASTEYLRSNNLIGSNFYWQSGYGAFSYSQSQIDNVIKYINNQQIHHKRKTFYEEYLEFLEKFKIQFDKKYILDK